MIINQFVLRYFLFLKCLPQWIIIIHIQPSFISIIVKIRALYHCPIKDTYKYITHFLYFFTFSITQLNSYIFLIKCININVFDIFRNIDIKYSHTIFLMDIQDQSIILFYFQSLNQTLYDNDDSQQAPPHYPMLLYDDIPCQLNNLKYVFH